MPVGCVILVWDLMERLEKIPKTAPNRLHQIAPTTKEPTSIVHKPYREHEIFDVMAEHLGVEYVYEQRVKPSEPKVQLSPGQLDAALSDSLAQ